MRIREGRPSVLPDPLKSVLGASPSLPRLRGETLSELDSRTPYGNASGPIGALDPLDLAEAGSVFFTRPHLASYIATPEERNQRTDDLHRLYREGKLTVTIDRELPLSMAKAAHDVIEERQSKGKILLKT